MRDAGPVLRAGSNHSMDDPTRILPRLARSIAALVLTAWVAAPAHASMPVLALPAPAAHVHTAAVPAVHTAAPAVATRRVHVAAHHHGRRHVARRHSAHVAQLSRHRDIAPHHAPRPLPHRSEHRAALPHVQRHRGSEGGTRQGGRHASALPAHAHATRTAARPVEPHQQPTLFSSEHPVNVGRGPPASGRFAPPPAPAPAPFAPARAAPPAFTRSRSSHRSASGRQLRAARRDGRFSPVETGRSSDLPPADRPEGAVAGSVVPSTGDHP